MEKIVIEHLILYLDQRQELKLRDDLMSIYVKYWPMEFDECSLFEIVEKIDTAH